jgi:uracil-DNA glycosylase
MAESRNQSMASFVADLREQLLYLAELGIVGVEVSLPPAQTEGQSVARRAVEKAASLERFIPEPLPALPVRPNTAPRSESNVRQSLLERSRLSARPISNKADTLPSGQKTNITAESKDMASKKISLVETNPPPLFTPEPKTLPPAEETLEEIRGDVGNCTRCPLWEGRTKIVHSEGNPKSDLLFIGEAPGANEDAEGRPFVGRAGQLLNKIIEAIGLKREDVFIGNVNRCRPPGNRQPTLSEANTCKQFLLREIAVVRPKIIVVLGNTATQNLLDTKVGIGKLRGSFQDYYGVKVMPTFHPAYLLRDPTKKRETWEDMKKVRDELERLK